MRKNKQSKKRFYRCEKGFTLIEMMIVLVIISILLLIAVPNLAKNQNMASQKGCEATKDLIITQYYAYEIENGESPDDLEVLKTHGYIDKLTCPNGDEVNLGNLWENR